MSTRFELTPPSMEHVSVEAWLEELEDNGVVARLREVLSRERELGDRRPQ